MEMSTKLGRCSYCEAKIIVPLYTHAVQCPVCHNTTRVHPTDPLSQAQNSISSTATRFRDLLNTASTNINTIVRNYSGTGTYHSRQTKPSPSLIPVSPHGRKRAVLCGVSYYGQRYRLNGTINDVKCMKFFLIQKVGFPSDSILVLTEEESNPSLIPTMNNIRKALRWLVQGCQSGDSLIFHFSGHGSQQLDFNGDEVDGYDETLWPVDHQREGTILDDEINATIVRPLPRGAKLHAIIDTCHSGTILDLPFVCRMDRKGYYMWEDHGHHSPIYKGTSGGLAVSISACDDHQVSVDTTGDCTSTILFGIRAEMAEKPLSWRLIWSFKRLKALSGDAATGAMTYSFIQAAQNEPGLTYGRLLNAMRQTIRDSKTRFLQTGPVTSLVKKVLNPKLPQEPQLSSSEKFEVYTRQFEL